MVNRYVCNIFKKLDSNSNAVNTEYNKLELEAAMSWISYYLGPKVYLIGCHLTQPVISVVWLGPNHQTLMVGHAYQSRKPRLC